MSDGVDGRNGQAETEDVGSDEGSDTDGGFYGGALEGLDRDLYLRAGELDVSDEIRVVRVKARAALAAGDDPACRAWLDMLVRLCNVALRVGARDEVDEDFLELVRGGGGLQEG